MNIGERIQMLRKERGLTQKSLAEKTGIPVRTIINYENSCREPNAKNMAALERYFNVSGEYLRGESDQITRSIVSNPELLEDVRNDLPKRMKELALLLEDGGDAEAELAYHLVNELVHILKMEDRAQRNAALSILQDIVVASVFFLDACENTSRDAEAAERIEYAKNVVRPRFEQALEKSRFFFA